MANKIFGAELQLKTSGFFAGIKAAGSVVDGLIKKIDSVGNKSLHIQTSGFTASLAQADAAVATTVHSLGWLKPAMKDVEDAAQSAANAVWDLTGKIRDLDKPLKGLSAVGSIVKGFNGLASATTALDKNLPAIVGHLNALPAALQAPSKTLSAFGTDAKKTATDVGGLNTSLNGVTAKLNKIATAAEKTAIALGLLSQAAPAITHGATAMGQALTPLQNIMTGVGAAAKGAQQNMGQASTTASKFATSVAKIVGAANSAGITVGQAAVHVGKMNAAAAKASGPLATFTKALSSAQKAAASFVSGIGHIGQTVERVGLSMRNLGGALTAISYGMERTAVSALKVNSSFDGARLAFTHFTGSAAAADKIIQKMKEIAATSPFEFSDIQGWLQRLTAVGVESETAFKWITKVGDAASYLGGDPRAKAESLLNAVIQMKAQGTVLKEELNQIAQTGVGAFQIMHDKLGVATSDIGRIGELGISSAKAIDAIMTALGEQYVGGMAAYSTTLSGMWSMLVDNVTFAADAIGASLTRAFNLKEVVKGMTETIGQVTAWFIKLTPETQRAAFALLAFLAALGPILLIGGQVLAFVGSLVTMFAALASPAGLAALALAGVAVEFVNLALTDAKTRKGIMEGWPALQDALVGVWETVRDAWPVVQAAIEGDWKGFEKKYAEFSGRLATALGKAWQEAWKIIDPVLTKAVSNTLDKIVKKSVETLDALVSKITSVISDPVGGLEALSNWMKDFTYLWTTAAAAALDKSGQVGELTGAGQHATGGLIRGAGSGTSDSIPSWLSDGEYVVNAKSTEKYAPLLERMNQNKYASGGSVGSVGETGLQLVTGTVQTSDTVLQAYMAGLLKAEAARDAWLESITAEQRQILENIAGSNTASVDAIADLKIKSIEAYREQLTNAKSAQLEQLAATKAMLASLVSGAPAQILAQITKVSDYASKILPSIDAVKAEAQKQHPYLTAISASVSAAYQEAVKSIPILSAFAPGLSTLETAVRVGLEKHQGTFMSMDGHLFSIDKAAMDAQAKETAVGDVGAIDRASDMIKILEDLKSHGDEAAGALVELAKASDEARKGQGEERAWWADNIKQSTDLAAAQMAKLATNTEAMALKGDAFGEALMAGKEAMDANVAATTAATAATVASTQQSLLSVAQEKIRASEFTISTEQLITKQSDLIEALAGTYTVATDSINASFEHIKNAGDMFQKYTTETWKMQQGATFINMQAIKDSQTAFLRLMAAMDRMAERQAARDAAAAAQWERTTVYDTAPPTRSVGGAATPNIPYDANGSPYNTGDWWSDPLANSPYAPKGPYDANGSPYNTGDWWSNPLSNAPSALPYNPMTPVNSATGQAGFGNLWETPLSNSPWSSSGSYVGGPGSGGGNVGGPEQPPVNVSVSIDGQQLLKIIQTQAAKYGSTNIYAW